jgi:hypothetical protein
VRIWTGLSRTVIELVIHAHAAQSGMGGLEAIQGNNSRLAVTLESLTEEGLGGGDVTRSTLGRIRRFCLAYQQSGRDTVWTGKSSNRPQFVSRSGTVTILEIHSSG